MNFKEFYQIYERAFHGSAQKIKGKFSYDKVGSGHGAQAFGYGFYFSESRSVASSYVAHSYKASYKYKGKDAIFWYNLYNDRGDYIKAEIWERIMLHKSKDSIKDAIMESEPNQQDLDYLESLPETLFAPAAGGLYEIELDATVDQLLDWQKPFSEQSDFIKNKLKSIENYIIVGYNYKYNNLVSLENMTGAQIYISLSEAFSVPTEADGLRNSQDDSYPRKDRNASVFLRKIGIKGNIYMSLSDGGDKRNIVMFSPDDIEIIKEL